MKKLKIFALLTFLLCLLAGFVACKSNALSAPTGFNVDENNKLTWVEVEAARRYKLSIKNVATGEEFIYYPNRESYSLSDLAEGDYEIRIMAIAGKDEDSNSDWSQVYEFHKDYETGCIYTLINNTEYEVSRVGTASGTVVIEDIYKGKPVTSIGENAFKSSARVENIVLGKNIVSINDNAFNGCRQLVSITLPASLQKIGVAAFSSCVSLKSIELPEGITVLEKSVFAYCKSLESVKFGSKLQTISDQVFRGCTSLKSVDIPDTVVSIGEDAFATNGEMTKVTIGASVETIGKNAFFQNTKLSELVFANKCALKTIGEYAFSQCDALTKVTLPSQTEDLGLRAFSGCTLLESVTIPESMRHVGKYAFDGTKLYAEQSDFIYADKWLVSISDTIRASLYTIDYFKLLDKNAAEIGTLKADVCGIADGTFAACTVLNSVKLPDTVKVLGKQAFYNNYELSRMIMQDESVVLIDDEAFRYCAKLSKLTLGEGLLKIGMWTFSDCKLLDNVNLAGGSLIPSTVESIGQDAFLNTALWSKPDATGIVYAGNWVVGYNKASLGAVVLKEGTAGVADYAFSDCTTLSAIQGLSYVKHIGRGAFYGCTGLLTVVLNQNLSKIEDYTFYKCSSLIGFGMPVGLTSIGRAAFYKCERLEAIDLSVCAVEEIAPYAFYGCASVITADLGSNVKNIGEYAFYKCSKLEKLIFPDTLRSIGSRAYSKCESLKQVDFGSGVESIGDYAFQGCGVLESIILPGSLKNIGNYAFYKCNGATEVVLSNGIEKIGEYAFYNLGNVENLVLPASITSIGKYAFKGWNSLGSILVNGNVENVGMHAFYGSKDVAVTIYTNAKESEIAWNERWNSSYRPVVWGCTLSDDATYVVSVKIEANTFSNVESKNGFTAPERAGYAFVGWAVSADGEVVYTAQNIAQAPVGTTLYAVWEEVEENVEPEMPEEGA